MITVKPLPLAHRPRQTRRLAHHAVAEVDDAGDEGAGLDEIEIYPSLAPRKERRATANQHREDPDTVLVDQIQCGHLDGKRRPADRDVALSRAGS